MNILVFFKTVPVWERVLEEDWQNFSPGCDLSYAGTQLNCFDESALEIGLRLKDELMRQGRDVFCCAATAGALHPVFAQTLFAAGYDDVASIGREQPEFSPEATAEILAGFAAKGAYDLILTGSTAGMADTGTVPFFMAHALSLPVLPGAQEVHISAGGVEALFREADGLWKRRARTPLVITVGNSPAVLRAVTLRARLAAKGRGARAVTPQKKSERSGGEIIFSRLDESRACSFIDWDSINRLAGSLLKTELARGDYRSSPNKESHCPENAVVYEIGAVKLRDADAAVSAILSDWRRRKPDYALLPDTDWGRLIAANLAAETGAFLMTGASFSNGGELLMRRACASNVVMRTRTRLPAVLTMAKLPEASARISIAPEKTALPPWLMSEAKIAPTEENNLKNPRLVIACGAGMGSRENCEAARRLAKKLGAGFGLTRMAALSGWGEPEEIIGQSGAAISPEICLALGASGAGAFMVGIEGAARIVAVNHDRSALIFRRADAGVVADAPALVNALLKALERA